MDYWYDKEININLNISVEWYTHYVYQFKQIVISS